MTDDPLPSFGMIRASFAHIYRTAHWGAGSGSGSAAETTLAYRNMLQAALDRWKPATVLDLGCGDWRFSRLIDWHGIDYLGIDVVAEVVEKNRRDHGAANIRFELRDIFADPPEADLLLCKDVLQHWPIGMISRLIAMLPRYRRALITNCTRPRPVAGDEKTNSEIGVGQYRPLDLNAAPFRLGLGTVLEYVTPDKSRHQKAVLLWDRAAA